MVGIAIGLIILIFVARAMIKGKYATMVLMTSGIFMLLCAIALGQGDFLPAKGAKPTGSEILNIIEYIRYMMSHTFSKLGLLIMLMVGFASYMTHIGANDAFVNLTTKKLQLIKNPYVMIFFAAWLCQFMSMVITSASGLGVLCIALLGPTLISLGLNVKTVASVAALSGCASMTFLGASTAASAQTSGISVLDYVMFYKNYVAVFVLFAMNLSLVFWSKYLDKKEGYDPKEHIGEKIVFDDAVKMPTDKAPIFYALLPFLPMILMFVFSKYGIDLIKLDVPSIVLLSIVIASICEAIRYRFSFDPIASGVKVFFQAMGRALSGVVILIVAAGVFAQGFKALGLIEAIVNLANVFGLGGMGMSIIFSLITTAVAIIAGSNGASFYPMLEFAPVIAAKLKVETVMLVLPMHLASTIARPLSPVAGVVVAISGMLKLNPFDIVKRVSVPVIIGLIVNQIASFMIVL